MSYQRIAIAKSGVVEFDWLPIPGNPPDHYTTFTNLLLDRRLSYYNLAFVQTT